MSFLSTLKLVNSILINSSFFYMNLDIRGSWEQLQQRSRSLLEIRAKTSEMKSGMIMLRLHLLALPNISSSLFCWRTSMTS
jgi:hypothetical protein